ncbi:hypothetical protein CYMTET_51689 [Cymbomonas tetramitiformis]|uniref:Nucleotide-diphospho-sugar transferase domain-containing protein n=1 Tax=Cymbomonas tetramitiformis TaxID=36881 RepID=A0AAE0BMF0_9CHLO|nr:hypothetical protein CYMTET_51689 [Cymbomonas tetramitiformis]
MSSDEQRTGNMNQCLQIKFYVRLLVLACVTLCPEASNRVRPPPTGVGNSRDPKLAIPQHKCLQYKKQTCGKHCCNSRVFSFSDKENIFEMLAEKEPALAEEIQERHLRSVGKVKDLQSCDIEATDCFKRVLETRTFQQELILSAVNYAYMDLALNLVFNLETLGIAHYILIADAEDVCARLESVRMRQGNDAPGVACVWTSYAEHLTKTQSMKSNAKVKHTGSTNKLQGYARNGKELMDFIRLHYLKRCARLQVNCMSVDSATIFTRSPYTVLHKEPLSDFNLIVASDGEYANVDFVYAQDAEPGGAVDFIFSEIDRLAANNSKALGEAQSSPGQMSSIQMQFNMAVASAMFRPARAFKEDTDLLQDHQLYMRFTKNAASGTALINREAAPPPGTNPATVVLERYIKMGLDHLMGADQLMHAHGHDWLYNLYVTSAPKHLPGFFAMLCSQGWEPRYCLKAMGGWDSRTDMWRPGSQCWFLEASDTARRSPTPVLILDIKPDNFTSPWDYNDKVDMLLQVAAMYDRAAVLPVEVPCKIFGGWPWQPDDSLRRLFLDRIPIIPKAGHPGMCYIDQSKEDNYFGPDCGSCGREGGAITWRYSETFKTLYADAKYQKPMREDKMPRVQHREDGEKQDMVSMMWRLKSEKAVKTPLEGLLRAIKDIAYHDRKREKLEVKGFTAYSTLADDTVKRRYLQALDCGVYQS